MPKKKNSSTPSHKPPPSPSSTPPSSLSTVNQDPQLKFSDSDPPSVIQDCQRASTYLRNKKIKKSLKVIQESLSRHPNSTTLHRHAAFIHHSLSLGNILHSPTSLHHLEAAAEHAEKGQLLAPNSIGLAHLHVYVLFKLAQDPDGYQQVIEKCERALSIQDPIDPVDDVFPHSNKNEKKACTTKEARIEEVKENIQALKDKARLACMMKKRGVKDGEDIVIDYQRAEGVLSFIETRKSQQEKRKQIGEGMHVLMNCQKKLHFDGRWADDNDQRRKMARSKRRVPQFDKQSRILEFWKTMIGKEKRVFLDLKIEEIRHHLSHRKLYDVVFMEAVNFGKKTGSWKYWDCCSCGETFLDWNLWRNHVIFEHIGILSSQQEMVMPEEPDAVWVKEIVSGVWKPMDLDRVVKDIVGQSKKDGTRNAGALAYGRDAASDSKEKLLTRVYGDEKKWPICEDVQRETMLEKIRLVFRLFLSRKCLAPSIISMIVQYTMEQLQNLNPQLEELIPGLDKTPLCTCFLAAEQLQKVSRLLDDLYNDCQLIWRGDKDNCSYDEVSVEEEYKEKVVFTADFTHLFLDEQSLREDFDGPEDGSAVADQGITLQNPQDDLSDDNPFVNWLFTGDSTENLTMSWLNLRRYKHEKAMQAFDFLETEFHHLQRLCLKKFSALDYKKDLRAVENICLEEDKRREELSGYHPQSYNHLLLKRKNELLGEGDSKCEVYVISHIMGLSRDIALASGNMPVSDFEARIHEEKSNKNMLLQEETCIRKAIERIRMNAAEHCCLVDVLIMNSMAEMKQMEQTCGWLSAFDYRTILLHLMKGYAREQLVLSADKDAKEKADAARDALLAELANDSTKNIGNGVDVPKKAQKKSKKEKRKYQRKSKNKETHGSDKHHQLDEESAEVLSPMPSNCDHLRIDEPKEQVEKLRRQVENEEMQIKHAEMLELQRQFEDEAKRKRLAETCKNMDRTLVGVAADGVPAVYSESSKDHESIIHKLQQQSDALSFSDNWIRWTDMINSLYQVYCPVLHGGLFTSAEENASGKLGKLEHSRSAVLPGRVDFMKTGRADHQIQTIESKEGEDFDTEARSKVDGS